MTSKGQITLPAHVRRAMDLQRQGDKLTLDFKPGSQQVVLSKPMSFTDIQARARQYRKPDTTPLADADAYYNTRESRQ